MNLKTFKEFLIERSATVTTKEFTAYPKFMNAVFSSDIKLIEQCLEEGADVDYIDSDFWTPLTSACRFGDYEVVDILLKYGADVNVVGGSQDSTPLALVLTTQSTVSPSIKERIVKTLIKAGADINKANVSHWTPLMALARDNISYLFSYFKGANTTAKSKLGETAIDIAKRYNNKEFLDFFGVSMTE